MRCINKICSRFEYTAHDLIVATFKERFFAKKANITKFIDGYTIHLYISPTKHYYINRSISLMGPLYEVHLKESNCLQEASKLYIIHPHFQEKYGDKLIHYPARIHEHYYISSTRAICIVGITYNDVPVKHPIQSRLEMNNEWISDRAWKTAQMKSQHLEFYTWQGETGNSTGYAGIIGTQMQLLCDAI